MLEEKFGQTLFHYLDALRAKHWLVGFSGGLDSTVLLFLLHRFNQRHPELKLDISCVHVNHGLSIHANDWQSHCQAFCHHLGIPFVAKTIELDVNRRGNLEQRAREARYQAISDVSSKNTVLFLGHHLDDQAETLLFRLARGAGPSGLSSMAPWSETSSGVKFRPLLAVSKQELDAFAVENNLTWINDESNEEDEFDRNFIRNQLIPLATERWPSFAHNLARSAALCAEQQQLLDEQCEQHLRAVSEGETLNITLLRGFSSAWQSQILRRWLMLKNVPMPSVAQLAQLKDQILNAKEDSVPTINIDGRCISRFQDRLYLYQQKSINKVAANVWDTHVDSELSFNHQHFKLEQCGEFEPGFYLQGPSIDVSVGGFSRRFKPYDSQVSKPLNQWFKLWKVPPWERHLVPIFSQDNEVLQVGEKVSHQKAAKVAASKYKIVFI